MPVGTGFYLLNPARCSAGAARRITRNNIAQADGEITHRKFKSGYVAELNVQLWQASGSGGQPACGGQLRAMADLLDQYLEAIANADGQLVWQPSTFPEVGGTAPEERMIDQARSMGPSGQGSASGFVSVIVNKDPDSPLIDVTFALLSPLPYAIDVPVTTSDIPGGGTITTHGSASYYPIIRVYGPTTAFTIINENVLDEAGNPLEIVYDSTLPGASSIAGGHYVEIDCFKNTIYLDGGTTSRKAGIDARYTDFFPLAPGANLLVVTGSVGDVKVLWRDAWI